MCSGVCYSRCDADYIAAIYYRLFYGYWPDVNGRGRTNLVVEQVSHHPPITAYYLENESKGLKLQGHSAQKTSFSGACGDVVGGRFDCDC